VTIQPASLKRREEQRGAAVPLPAVPGVDPRDPVPSHVDGQIRWYDQNARRTRAWHFWLRGAQIVFAAAMPITKILPAAIGGGLRRVG
jgi:hypothetical protein